VTLRRETAADIAARFVRDREARAARDLATREELARLLKAATKRCAACGEEKPQAEFYPNRRYENHVRCMRCDADPVREVKAAGRQWRQWRDGRTNPVFWTASSVALLGTAPDRVVAEHLGCSVAAVLKKRRALGIAPYQVHRVGRARRERR
jgi:hypothetical protein